MDPQRIKLPSTPYNLLTIPTIPQPLRRRADWHRVIMDRLLENDTRTCVWLTEQEHSDVFLDFIFPEWLLLPKGETLVGLLETLKTAGQVRSWTDGQNTKYTWSKFPKPNNKNAKNREAKVAAFLNGVRAAVHEACGVSCFEWDSRSSTKPLDGAYAVRKPDLTCFFRAPEGACNRGWERVVTFGEVKNRTNTKKEKESFLELAGKASCLLGAQDGRHFVSCIRILGPCIYLSTFHRSGSISTCSYDIHASPLQFLRILIGVSLSDYITIGFDTSIKWGSLDQVLKSRPPDSENDSETHSDSQDSQDSRSLRSESSDGQYSWSTPESASATDRESSGSESSSVIDNDEAQQNDESSADREGVGRKWVEITDVQGKRLRVWLKSVLAISDSLVGQGTTVWEAEIDTPDRAESAVVVKDSWIDPLRKYTEGMILSILEQYHIEGVPTLVSEEQVKTHLPIPDHPYPLANSSTHFLRSALPSDSSFQLRILSRLVIRPVGKLVLEFSSLGELLVSFLDYIVVHENALKIAGILHRDISPPNLWFGSAKGRTDHSLHMQHLRSDSRARLCQRIRNLKRRGVLGDWGYATPVMTLPASHSSESSSQRSDDLGHDNILTSPVEPASELVAGYDNCVPVRKIGSNDPPELLPVSKLTNQHDIILLMGSDDPNEDPRKTIDICPLYRTGTWSWMSAQLAMAGPEKPVTHDALHDLESFFYVLVGICTLYDGPFKQKSEEDLEQCYDKFFNTFKPSVLKTITIQSDLTWQPFIVDHINPYFAPLIPLLTALRSEIILPLATDKDGRFYRKGLCNHGTFIKHIVTALSELKPKDWAETSPDTTRSATSSRRPSSAVTGPPLWSKALLSAPPIAPKNFLPGRGIIRSDPGIQHPMEPAERRVRRAREPESDSDYHPPSPSKRTRIESSQAVQPYPHLRLRSSHSTGEILTASSTSGNPIGQ